jgi:hypothetical protein
MEWGKGAGVTQLTFTVLNGMSVFATGVINRRCVADAPSPIGRAVAHRTRRCPSDAPLPIGRAVAHRTRRRPSDAPLRVPTGCLFNAI